LRDERQIERNALIDERDNYYAFSTTWWKAFSARRRRGVMCWPTWRWRALRLRLAVELVASIQDIGNGYTSSRAGARNSSG